MKDILNAIEKERKYQDKKWGTIEDRPHSVPEWLTIMHNELSEAMQAWAKHSRPDGDEYALQEILQVVAVGVACMEQHGTGHERSVTKESEGFARPSNRKPFASTRSKDGEFPI